MAVMRMGYAARVTDLAEAKHHYANTLGLLRPSPRTARVYPQGLGRPGPPLVVPRRAESGSPVGFKVEYSTDIDLIEKKAQEFGLTVERMSKAARNPGDRRRHPVHRARRSMFEVITRR